MKVITLTLLSMWSSDINHIYTYNYHHSQPPRFCLQNSSSESLDFSLSSASACSNHSISNLYKFDSLEYSTWNGAGMASYD